MKKDDGWKLLGSEASLETIAVKIGKYFFCDTPYALRPTGDKTYDVLYPETSKKAGQQVANCRVRVEKGRYRFEMNYDQAKKDLEKKGVILC